MMTPAFAPAAEAAIGTWLSPPAGQRIMTICLEVSIGGHNTHSDLKITRIELWVDGKIYSRKNLANPDTRGVCSFSWDTSEAGCGSHDLIVKLYSYGDLVSTVSGTGRVGAGAFYDIRPPVVTFANLEIGRRAARQGSVKLDASSDDGQSPLEACL